MADVTIMIGSSRTAEYFATNASPTITADSHHAAPPGLWSCRHQAATAARKKNAMQASEVTNAPWARKSVQKTKNPSDSRAPALPKRRRDQQNTSAPVAMLNSAI